MSPYVEVVLVILLPTAVGYGVVGLVRMTRWASGRWPAPRAPEPEPIERLTRTLRRLRAELETLENRSGVPNKHVRVGALRGAYLDALVTACQRLEVSPPAVKGAPASPRWDQAEVYRAEAVLRQRGLDVREPASR